jgi:hypothetical protein
MTHKVCHTGDMKAIPKAKTVCNIDNSAWKEILKRMKLLSENIHGE